MGSRELYFQIICTVWLVLFFSGCIRPITTSLPKGSTNSQNTKVLTTTSISGVTNTQQASVPQDSEGSEIEPASGAFVTEYGEYGLFFVVEPESRDQLAAYLISCDPYGWSLPVLSGLVGSEIAIKNGKFLIDNNDVHVEGEFVEPIMIKGTLEAKSKESTRCGLPENAEWTAQCGAPHPITSLIIGGKTVSTGQGPCK